MLVIHDRSMQVHPEMTLENLEAGDDVAVSVGTQGEVFITPVERVTATHIILARDKRYRKKDGNQVGGGTNSFFIPRIAPVTYYDLRWAAYARVKAACASLYEISRRGDAKDDPADLQDLVLALDTEMENWYEAQRNVTLREGRK